MHIYDNQVRHDIISICQRLYARGFIVGTEGNVSVRVAPDRLWITPTGFHKGFLRSAELLLVDLDGRVHLGRGQPSSEVPLHLALYRARSDIQAVVHAHPPIATALTVARYALESTLLPEAVVVLGEVPTIPYQMPTTPQFARDVAAGHVWEGGGFARESWLCHNRGDAPRGFQPDGNRRACRTHFLPGEDSWTGASLTICSRCSPADIKTWLRALAPLEKGMVAHCWKIGPARVVSIGRTET